MLKRNVVNLATRLAIAVTLAFVSISALAESPLHGEPFAADAQEVLKTAAAIKPDKYPYTTILLDDSRYSIDDAGRVTVASRMIYRIDSPQAVQGWGKISVYWEPWHQEKPEIKVRVITPDAKVFWLDEKTLSDSPARQESDDIYTDTRYVGGPIPAISAGCIVEQYYVRRDKAPAFDGGTLRRYLIGGGVPTEATRLTVEYPASIALKTKIRNLPGLTQRKEEANGRVRLVFEHGRLDPFPPTPQLLAPEVITRGMVEFSTSDSWKSINDIYFRTVSEKIRTADVEELVRKTVQPKDPQRLTIAKLVARLHQEVRYTGIEFGEASIVPRTPGETLQRHFGDCKDKSTLLVAMLRAAGIPANLALVRSTVPDIDPEIPGFSLFDHAIVYVPGKPDLWIDATAEYNVLGNVPAALHGKYALVIDGKGDRPIRIPESGSKDNTIVEKREFFLADYGPARVVETGTATGFVDSGYRSYFTGPANKGRKEGLESYGKNVYLADGVSEPKMPDGRDLLNPFTLEIEFTKARRGFTDVDDAVAAVRIEGLFARMPQWFTTAKDEKKTEKPEDPEPPRTQDYVFEPSQTEWRYKIHPPLGYASEALPSDVDRKLGPGHLTQAWKKAADGTVEGVIRFDSGKGRYSVAEAEAARDAIVQALKEPAIMIRFQNTGSSLIAAGKIREGLAEYERVIAAEPKQALHRVRLSRALLQAGLGEQARREAEAAVKLDPQSVQAYNNLGWVLEHDIIGRRLERGFDRDGAIAAYKKAMELDPKDYTAFASAGIVSEYNTNGERYAEGSNLADAIAYYRAMKPIDKDEYARFEINELLCLVYARKFDEVLSQLGNRAAENSYRYVALAAIAASKGSEAALLQANRYAASPQERSTNLSEASRLLLFLRLYPQAANLIAAAVPGADDASSVQSQAELFRRTKRAEEVAPKASDPASAIHNLFVALGNGRSNDDVLKLLSRSWRKSSTERGRAARLRYMRPAFMNVLGNSGLPDATALDIILSNTEYSVEGNDETGYRVWVRLPDSEAQPLFVVKEDGVFRVLAFRTFDPLGWEALERVRAGHTKAAAKLLDWARQQFERGGGDDPLSGDAFANLWDKGAGANADRNAIELGAVTLALSGSEDDLTPDVERLIKTLPESKRVVGQQILWGAYLSAKKLPEALAVAEQLAKEYPKSQSAFVVHVASLMTAKRFSEMEKIARDRLAGDPDDEPAINMLSEALVGQQKVAEAREFIRPRIKAGRAKAGELNNYAWHALFTGADDEALEIARRSASVSSQADYSILHTLACLYAERGKTAEAREVMLKAMKANYLDELDSALWYVYGRIAEQYGQDEAARAAYGRVDKPEPSEMEEGSTYKLAVLRLAKMDASHKPSTSRNGSPAGK